MPTQLQGTLPVGRDGRVCSAYGSRRPLPPACRRCRAPALAAKPFRRRSAGVHVCARRVLPL
eukprot:1286871-Pleurochrysis_carterae.AAC.1